MKILLLQQNDNKVNKMVINNKYSFKIKEVNLRKLLKMKILMDQKKKI